MAVRQAFLCTWTLLRKQARQCFGRKPQRILGVECATQRVPRRPFARVRARVVLGVQLAGGAPGYFGVYLCKGWSCDGGGGATHVAQCPLLRVREETMETKLDGTTVRRRRRVRCESTGET